MRDVLKIIHYFSLIANYDRLDKTGLFFKLLLILSIRKSAIKRGTFFISCTEYKIRKFLFIYHKSISSFVHLTSKTVLKMIMY